jgi:hypothetical protein
MHDDILKFPFHLTAAIAGRASAAAGGKVAAEPAAGGAR